MTNTMKLIFVPVGAIVGGIIALILKQAGVLGADFDGRWFVAGLALVGLVIGHHIDNKRECAQIARELDAETSTPPTAAAQTFGVGRVLLSQSGVTVFLLIFSLFGGLLLFSMSAVLFIMAANDTFFSWVLIIIGCLFLIPFLKGCFRKIQCYENGIFVRNLWRRGFVAFNEICALRYYALSKSTNGIPQGTACVLEIVPLHERTLKFEVFGTTGDSRKTWNVVLLARQMNPEIEMRQY